MKAIYLDSNVFIYSATNTGETGSNACRLLDSIQNNEILAVTSCLTIDEVCYAVSKISGNHNAVKLGEALLKFNNLKVADATKETMQMALEIMKKYNALPRDAIHAATLIENNAEAIISEDKDFDRIKEIKKFTIKEFLKNIK